MDEDLTEFEVILASTLHNKAQEQAENEQASIDHQPRGRDQSHKLLLADATGPRGCEDYIKQNTPSSHGFRNPPVLGFRTRV